MKFDNMPSWKDWLPFEGINFAFPRLRTMKLLNCPELRGDLPSHLSCMEEIEIGNCYKLSETPPTLNWLSVVKKVRFEEDLNHQVYDQSTPRLMFISKMIMSSICLTHLKLWNIESLTAFPTNGLPTSLQSLFIGGCRKLSFMPPEMWRNHTALVSLELFNSCDALTSFSLDGFPALKSLSIRGCRSLSSIFISETSSRQPSSLQSLEILSRRSFEVNLRLDTLTNLEYLSLSCSGEFSFREGVCLPPKLQTIWIKLAGKKMHVKEWGFQELTALSRLTIQVSGEMCSSILMIDSSLPISLVSLRVGGNLSFEGNGLRHLSSLQNLTISKCQHLKSLLKNGLPSSLKSLQFYDCDKLESLPEDSFPTSLKRLAIDHCPLLEERYKRKENWSKIAHIPLIRMNDQVTI